MKKKLLLILTVLLSIMLVATAFACNDYTDPDDSTPTEETLTRTQVITNGTFYKASSSTKDSYIKETVTGWTATNGTIGPNDTDAGVTMGVIDLANEGSYNVNKDRFASDDGPEFTYPGVDPKTPKDTDDNGNLTDELQDTNALVIASKKQEGSMYFKNSSSFTLEAGKYYELSYSLVTNIDLTGVATENRDKKGAWVNVTGGVEFTDACINTNGQWVTRKLYIETNKLSSTTIDIRLWLGNGPATSGNNHPYLTRGAVIFDNIICKEVTEISDAAYQEGAVKSLNHGTFADMAKQAVTNNSAYAYRSAYYITDTGLAQMTETAPTASNASKYFYSFRPGTYSATNVANYTMEKGKKGLSSSEAPNTNYAYTGIVDLSKLYAAGASADSKDVYSGLLPSNYSFIAPTYTQWNDTIMNGNRGDLTKSEDTFALMISHNDLSGAGFVNKKPLTIESGANYVISVWAYVWAPTKENGKIDYPKANAPTEPTDKYTEAQEILVEYYKNTKLGDGYFDNLNTEEKAIVDGAQPTPTTAVDTIKALVASTDFVSALNTVYDEKVSDMFKYKYLSDNFDAYVTAGSLVEGDREYINYCMLDERSKFLNNTWKTTKTIMDKKDKYDDEYLEYMSKYTVWEHNGNEQPYAKVKLTGAGDDIEAKTEKCNDGWEQITFYVKGNQLSSRNLTLEFWFGEGSATEYENLMFGGVFFDDISIVEISDEVKNSNYSDKDWKILSPLTDAKELDFGALAGDESVVAANISSHWTKELAEGAADGDVNKVSVGSKLNEEFSTVVIDQAQVVLNQLVYTHSEATASTLTCSDSVTVKPNKAYRFAMWIKTDDMTAGKGVNIELLGKKLGSDDDMSAVSTVSTFNKDKWTEVVFYVLGDALETNEVSLRFSMGSGTRFSTDGYVAGTVNVAVINITEIKYSEFNSSSKSGDEVKSYTFSNTSSATDSVTNGNFSAIDYSATEEKEFDENGVLVGVAKPSNWTNVTAKNNTFNTINDLDIKLVSDTTYRMSWTGVKGVDRAGNDTEPTAYEVYAKFLDDGKSVERLCAIIPVAGFELLEGKYFYNVDMAGVRATSFRVRAVSDDAVSAYSSYVTPASAVADGTAIIDDDLAGKREYKMGTTSADGKYVGSDYVSPYGTVLTITANYNVAVGMTASSQSLSANSYYKLSVWVKTEGDLTKASVTVSNLSKTLTADVEQNYIGYTGINTDGKWTQYCFIINTGNSSSSLTLELSLGNKYAVKTNKTSTAVTTSTATYDKADLSMGTVYFGDIHVDTLTEKAYNEELEKGEYVSATDKTVKLHDFDYRYAPEKNQYAIRNLVYTVDSFDSFTENTTAQGSNGYNLGHTPNSYDWAKASDATGTTEEERLYGVYNYQYDAIEKLMQLYTNDNDESDADSVNVFKDFMPEGFDIRSFVQMSGYNSLVMSNKTLFGQSYSVSSAMTIAAESYYKLTFSAKTMIARGVKENDVMKYYTDGVNAEFRFMQTATTDKYQSILINSKGRTDNINEAVEYTMYIYNPSTSSASAKWAFHLGANADDKDTTGSKQLIIGMMVIDQVSMTKITEADFNAAKTETGYDGLDDNGKVNAATRFYSYDPDEPEEPADNEGDGDDEKEKDKNSIWDKGDTWLLISSLVIAVVIIVVVVVVLVRRWKKKHPKEVVGENVVKTEKDVPVVVPSQDKEEAEDDDEYSDEKPVYVNRVLPKKNKKKKKK